MKLKVALVLMMSMMFALGLAGVAVAQTTCESFTATHTFTNGSAPPGGSDTLCGTVPPNITGAYLYLDETVIGNAVTDENGDFCINFTVPTTAAEGPRVLSLIFSPTSDLCLVGYIVEAAVPAPPAEGPVPVAAPAAEVPVVATAPATLPSTGFMLIPAAGLLAGGLGTLLFRKRRR